MGVAYGINVKDSDDLYVLNAEEALNGIVEAGIPGSFLVDLIPTLKYVPAWFPGAGFKRKASHWSKVNTEVVEKPFQFVSEQMITPPSYAIFPMLIRYLRKWGLPFLLWHQA